MRPKSVSKPIPPDGGLKWPRPRLTDFEHWLSIKEALGKIVRVREVGPREAEILLLTACRSRRVRSRYLAFWEGRTIVTAGNSYLDLYLADLDDKPRSSVQLGEDLVDPRRLRMEYRAIHASMWDVDQPPQPGFVDLKTGIFRAEDAQGSIQIHAHDLNRWLARPPKGPAPGTVSRYAEADQALFPEIARLMSEKKISTTEAARRLMLEGKVVGRGSDESRVRRLARAYKQRH